MAGRSSMEIRSQTIIAKRTLVRAMINSDSLATNKQAMEEFMRTLVEELEERESSAAAADSTSHLQQQLRLTDAESAGTSSSNNNSRDDTGKHTVADGAHASAANADWQQSGAQAPIVSDTQSRPSAVAARSSPTAQQQAMQSPAQNNSTTDAGMALHSPSPVSLSCPEAARPSPTRRDHLQ